MARVLIAEDERDIRESFVDILVYAGYDVIEAEDGGTAFELACREHPDIILLDVMMPVMDGFEVLKNLKETPTTEAIPVILLTALPLVEAEQDAMRLGADHYLAKPCDPEALELTVKVTLRESSAAPAKGGDDSKVWHGSNSYQRTPDDPGSQGIIRIGDNLKPLEQKLGGGIPRGSLTLVEGDSSAGKSVLCQHLTYGALIDGHSAVYFTSERTPKSLVTQMISVGLPVLKDLRTDKLCIYPVQNPEDDDADPLLGALAIDIERLPSQYDFIVVDAVTNLATYSQEQDIIGFFSACKRQCSKGRTIIVVAHSYALAENMFTRLGTLCDARLKLRGRKVRDKVVRMIEVVKVKNVELNRDNVLSFRVEPEVGIQIIPFSQTKV